MQAPSFLSPFDGAPVGPPPLVGIARMAAESENALERNDVDYNWIDCRTTLNRSRGERGPFEWSINPYRGCEFGCAYCYARYTHEYMELHGPMDFERRIFVKRNAAAQLQRELEKGRSAPGHSIVIGAATDPYQPAEKRFGVTRSLLEVLARFSGFHIGIITKSDLIVRDIPILKKIIQRHEFQIRMSITTTDHELARKMEPRAVTPRRRFDAVRQLNEAGIVCGIHLMPVMPRINDDEAGMERVCEAASKAGAAFLATQAVFLAGPTRRKFTAFISEHYPHLTKLYKEFYRYGIEAPDFYQRQLQRKVAELRKRHGLSSSPKHDDLMPASMASPQIDLFGKS